MAFTSSTLGNLRNQARRNSIPLQGMISPEGEIAKASEYHPPEPLQKATVRATTNGTDATRHGEVPQARVPLNVRNMRARTEWPMESTRPTPWEPAADRIYGNGLFRRYPSGNIDVKYALGVIEPALRKSYIGIPLNENEALATSAVFPDLKYKDLPKSLVSLKAPLSKSECSAIRASVSPESVDILRALGVPVC